MGLMGTLAKVAVGIAVAKGAEKMLTGNKGSAGDGGLFGGQHSPAPSREATGLEDIMGDVLGGRQSGGAAGGGMGGLGGLLENLQQQNPNTQDGGIDDLLRGGGSSGGAGGGLGSLLEGLTGGQSGAGAGGLGGLLGGLVSAASGQSGNGGFGDLLNQAMQQRGDPPQQPSQEQEAVAGLMLRAMIQAAKSDGKFDAGEQKKLMDRLGDVSAEERDFVNREMQGPVDVQGLARQTPRGLEQQVYTMSVLGIDLDNQNEAKYLHELATAFGIDKNTVNAIHSQMGAPSIYR